MTKFNKTLAAATLAAAAFAVAPAASAADYRKCKDTEAAVAGGLIGGSLGTIIGEEIAGRGDRTEGAIAGAVIGGIIGSAIGDGASDCEKDGRIYRNGRYVGNHSHSHSTRGYPTTTRVSHSGHGTSYGQRSRGYNNGYNRGFDQRDSQLRQIDRQIRDLREERRFLKDRARYNGYNRQTERRLDRIARRLDRLKDDRKRVKRGTYVQSYGNGYGNNGYRNSGYRNDGYRNGGHYHGNNLCYSNH